MKKFRSEVNKITKDKPSLTLALETSGRFGSVAIGSNDKIIGEKSFSGAMKHSAEIFPSIRELLEKHGFTPQQLSCCCISVGPGSFTGLRIAVTIAKMLNLAAGCEIVTIDTLDVIAANAIFGEAVKNEKIEKLAVILDAKRGRFFTGIYHRTNKPARGDNLLDNWEKQGEALLSAEQFEQKFTDSRIPVYLLGEGLVYYRDDFEAENTRILDEQYWTPKASNVYRLGVKKTQQGKFTPAVELAPKYIQKPDIRIPKI